MRTILRCENIRRKTIWAEMSPRPHDSRPRGRTAVSYQDRPDRPPSTNTKAAACTRLSCAPRGAPPLG